MDNVIKQPVLFRDLGWMEYREAWDYQEALLKENVRIKGLIRELQAGMNQAHDSIRRREEAENSGNDAIATADAIVSLPATRHYLLFVEHPPVYTLGKSGSISNVLINEAERQAKGISFYHTNRGGDITFHGPEQIVGYPILDLEQFYTDIGKYLRNLEEVIIATMADYGLKGERSPGETGVWMDAAVPGRERKICAMGIRCSRWVTMHGFAFNVNTDLGYFDYIIPCGIQNKKVTSMERELGRKLDVAEVKRKLKFNFEKIFDVELRDS
jgi:lipoate-protein ligase B